MATSTTAKMLSDELGESIPPDTAHVSLSFFLSFFLSLRATDLVSLIMTHTARQ